MSQQDIMNLLRKVKKPLSRGEIAEKLSMDPINVSHSLKRLLKYREIYYMEVDRFEGIKSYRCQRRLKLYYLK